MVKSLKIGKPDAAKLLKKEEGSTTIMDKGEQWNLSIFHISMRDKMEQ